MNSNYHTAETLTQSALRLARGTRVHGSNASEFVSLKNGPKRFGPLTRRTNREVLRAMRAAEMAAWEAAPPSTRPAPAASPARSLREIVAPHTRQGLDRETVLIGLLAVAGLVAVLCVLQDTSALLNRWTQFVDGIRNLLS